jgi:hypothetical protein
MQWKWKACCAVSFVRDQGDTHVADPPGDGALLAGGGGLVGLALYAQLHNMVPADGAVVNDDVPGPERDGVPLGGLVVVKEQRAYIPF